MPGLRIAWKRSHGSLTEMTRKKSFAVSEVEFASSMGEVAGDDGGIVMLSSLLSEGQEIHHFHHLEHKAVHHSNVDLAGVPL